MTDTNKWDYYTSMPGKSTKKTSNNAGCLIWLVALLIVLLLFVLNWNKIQETVVSTGFDKVIKLPLIKQQEKPDAGTGVAQDVASQTESKSENVMQEQPVTEPSGSGQKPVSQPDAIGKQNQPVQETKPAVTLPTGPVEQLKKTRVVSLYFIRVEDDGTIVRHEIKRTIEVSDSPLTDALNALLRGPGPDELANNLITLIPPGTKLLSVQVRGSTAIINFSEEFMYNRYGVEGYAGQLKQVVYTATSFPTVKDVQILIEGKRYEYLGGEGVYIGKPISRSSL